MEYGSHIEVPLPEGTFIEQYEDLTGAYFTLTYRGIKVGPKWDWFGEYPLHPPPNSDDVFGHLVEAGAEHDDAQQIVNHLEERGLVI